MNENRVLKIWHDSPLGSLRVDGKPLPIFPSEKLAFAAALEAEWFKEPVARVIERRLAGAAMIDILDQDAVTLGTELYTAPNAAATQSSTANSLSCALPESVGQGEIASAAAPLIEGGFKHVTPEQANPATPTPGTCQHDGKFFDADTLTCVKCELAAANAALERLRELAKARVWGISGSHEALRAELEKKT